MQAMPVVLMVFQLLRGITLFFVTRNSRGGTGDAPKVCQTERIAAFAYGSSRDRRRAKNDLSRLCAEPWGGMTATMAQLRNSCVTNRQSACATGAAGRTKCQRGTMEALGSPRSIMQTVQSLKSRRRP